MLQVKCYKQSPIGTDIIYILASPRHAANKWKFFFDAELSDDEDSFEFLEMHDS